MLQDFSLFTADQFDPTTDGYLDYFLEFATPPLLPLEVMNGMQVG